MESRIQGLLFTVELARGTPRQHKAPSCRMSCRMRFSAVDLSRKQWNWFNLNIFLLLSTWQRWHLFTTIHFCR
jgi:hypothetical protein